MGGETVVRRNLGGGAHAAISILLIALAMLLAFHANAQLFTSHPTTDAVVASRLEYVVTDRGQLSPKMLHEGQLGWQVADPSYQMLPSDSAHDIWIRFSVANRALEPRQVKLAYELPAVDEVRLYWPVDTIWAELTAGDTVAVRDWPMPGRYPQFAITLKAQESRQLYVRLRNSNPAPLALKVFTPQQAVEAATAQTRGLMASLGVALLTATLCLVLGWVYWQKSMAWFAAYAVALALNHMVITGMAGEIWLANAPFVLDRAKSGLPMMVAGFSLLLVRDLCRLAIRSRFWSRVTALVAVMAYLTGFAVFAMPASWAPHVLVPVLNLCALLVLWIAALTWWRGDKVGLWILLSKVPLVFGGVVVGARMWGVTLVEFDVHAVYAWSIALSLPLLTVALYLRCKNLRALERAKRQIAAPVDDHGAESAPIFLENLQVGVQRFRQSSVPMGLVYVRVANLDFIRTSLGENEARRTLIRTMIKLQRILGDAETLARLDKATFGAMFELAGSRQQLQALASRLVAHGLMPLKGDKSPLLKFHIGIAVLPGNESVVDSLHQALLALLDKMSDGTRRPIRLLNEGA
jgi:GGDEF domain-containing protein